MVDVSEEDQGAAGRAGEMISQAEAQQDAVGPKQQLARDQEGPFV